MFEVQEDTENVLVIRIGVGWNWGVFRLDRAAGLMIIERSLMFVRRGTLKIPFEDISQIGTVANYGQTSICVALRSGKRRWCPGEGKAASAQAVARLQRFLHLPAADAKLTSRLHRWVTAAVGAAVLLAAASKLISFVMLPDCDSETATETLDKLLNAKDAKITTADYKTITDGSQEKTCRATARSGTEAPAAINYRVYWDGWSKMVQITGVEAAARNRPLVPSTEPAASAAEAASAGSKP